MRPSLRRTEWHRCSVERVSHGASLSLQFSLRYPDLEALQMERGIVAPVFSIHENSQTVPVDGCRSLPPYRCPTPQQSGPAPERAATSPALVNGRR